MDEEVETSVSQMEDVEDGSHAPEDDAAGTAAATAVRALDLNELHEFPEKQLKALARDLDLHLHPARSRHQHILDIVRVAVAGGAVVSAEGFLDQVSDSFAMLRWPRLNFLPVPEDVAVPRTLIEQYDLRPGQRVAGTVRLPVQREKFLSLTRLPRSRSNLLKNGSNQPHLTSSRRSSRRAELFWKTQTPAPSARVRSIY